MNNQYNAVSVKKRILSLFDTRGLKPYKILPQLGLSKNTLDGSNTSMPKADTLAIIADYLETTTDYLLGSSDIPDINISVTQTDSIIESSQISVVNTPEKNAPTKELDEITAELLGIFQSLDFKKKVKVMNFILKESENIG